MYCIDVNNKNIHNAKNINVPRLKFSESPSLKLCI